VALLLFRLFNRCSYDFLALIDNSIYKPERLPPAGLSPLEFYKISQSFSHLDKKHKKATIEKVPNQRPVLEIPSA
jgi:hypothetical protein